MIASLNFLNKPYTFKNLAVLFLIAFFLRSIAFLGYVQHEERYFQSDTGDYHTGAVLMKIFGGMTYVDGRPVFWRTPGYPLYLLPFYKIFGNDESYEFSDQKPAQIAAIWVQIFLCSFVPILLFFFALLVTGSLAIAWLLGWLGAFHLGFILSCSYILSDAIALIFFILFLLFFYRSFRLWFEPSDALSFKQYMINGILAVLALAAYTWIRPNGQFIIAVVALLLLAGACTWKQKIIKIASMVLLFLALLMPWIIRNHRYTGHYFYCQMGGPVLQAFTLPKVMRDATGLSLEQCWKYHMYTLSVALEERIQALKKEAPHLWISRELVCAELASKEVFKHPFYFAWEWCKEATKATFDLYSSQIVSMLNSTQRFDPLEEHLIEKIKLCLYAQPMPFAVRLLMWAEFLLMLASWFGIIGGLFMFVIKPLWRRRPLTANQAHLMGLWLKLGFMAASLLFMTGGFGYARLRLPIDPLLMLMSLVFWHWLFFRKNNERAL